jgi:hypothetical protein
VDVVALVVVVVAVVVVVVVVVAVVSLKTSCVETIVESWLEIEIVLLDSSRWFRSSVHWHFSL